MANIRRSAISPEGRRKAKANKSKRRPLAELIALVLSVLVSINYVTDFVTFHDLVNSIAQSDHEKFKKSTEVSGIFIPPDFQNGQRLEFIKGRHHILASAKPLAEGITFQLKDPVPTELRNPIDAEFKYTNNRLFVKYKLYDINHLHLGEVDYDTWRLRKARIYDYYDDDSTLEVLDEANNLVFGMAFRHPNTIILQGYSTYPATCAIISTDVTRYFIDNNNTSINCKDSILRYTQGFHELPKRPEQRYRFFVLGALFLVCVVAIVRIVSYFSHHQ